MKQIQLTRGKFALVDDSDFDFLNQWKWYAKTTRNTMYASRRKYLGGGRQNAKYIEIIMHRLLLDVTEKKEKVDHKDGDGLNNQRENLRKCTHSQNLMNRNATSANPRKWKGVYPVSDRYFARIQVNGKKMYLGCFASEKEAALAYNIACTIHHGEFANLNMVE